MSWEKVLPELARIDDPATHELFSQAQEVSLPANTIVFHQGDQCSNYLLVLEGSVKVLSRAENGREIILYRLGSGDSCVLTTSCLFGGVPYPAEGSTETAVTALAIPAAAFKKAIQQSESFRTLVFQSFTDHLASVIALVEEIAFGRLGSRLARYLLEHVDSGQQLKTTHQVLATELGTAREVISRQLKEMEGRGFVHLQRGCIDLQDMEALKKLATQ